MEDKDIKMIIVMRRDLGMRKGKIAAQAGHACVEATLRAMARVPGVMQFGEEGWIHKDDTEDIPPVAAWLCAGQKKVCVYVDGEERLKEIHEALKSRGIISVLIQDAGHTEFHGEPTLTCLATEPRAACDLDPVTGELPLF